MDLSIPDDSFTPKDKSLDVDTDTRIQEILLAASNHDLTTLDSLIQEYTFAECEAVDVQDQETGFSALHAAIAACDVDEANDNDSAEADGANNSISMNEDAVPSDANGLSSQEELLEGARDTIKILFENGAIWNQLDSNGETPGCIALRLGLTELYGMMVDAGVRAEILLNRLSSYEPLDDDEEGDEDVEDSTASKGTEAQQSEHPPEQSAAIGSDVGINADTTSDVYLKSVLSRTDDKLLDEHSNGVMMAWETKIMSDSASALLPSSGLKILNIGFGMGIIDNYIRAHDNIPTSHHIIEAHPSVLSTMREKGWTTGNSDKPGLVVHEGKWQDVLPRLVIENEVFDAIYFDTFAEDYAAFRDFFSEQVIGLLNPEGGRWSFFNGMGADRQISYDVYQKVVEIDLFEAGFDIEWIEMDVPVLDKEWEGVKRKYWDVKKYRLPICKFMD